MSAGGEIGAAWYTIGTNLSPLGSGLKKSLSMLKSAGGMAATAGLAVGAAFAAGVGAAAVGGIKLVQMGADLQELSSKFDAVFKDSADGARQWAAQFASAVGRSEVELQGMLAGMQALLAPMGFARADAAQLSQGLTQLAVDLGSFNNASEEDVMAALKSGLMGEAEPMKQFGVVLNDVALDAKLLEMGIKGGSDAASEQQKIMARYAIILDSTKDAQGDAAKTSGSLSNQWKGLMGALVDLGSKIGQSLIPAATSVVSSFKDMGDWIAANMATVTSWGSMIGSVITSVVGWFVQLGTTVYGFIASGSSMFGDFGTNVGGAFTSIGSVASTIFSTLKSWIESVIFTFLNWDLVVKGLGIRMAEAFTNMVGRVQNFGSNVVALFAWVGREWQNIAFTMLDYTLTAMANLGQNIRTLFAAVIESIASGSLTPLTNAINNEMLGLTEGAVSAVSSMPEFKPFVATDAFKDQLAELDKEWMNRAEAWTSIMEENAPGMGEAISNGLKDQFSQPLELPAITANDTDKVKKKGGRSGVGSTTSLSSAFDKVQEAALQAKDKTPEKQLKALEKIAKNTDPKKQTKAGPSVALAG